MLHMALHHLNPPMSKTKAITGFSGCTAAARTLGSTMWVRIRTAGLKGVMGAWSNTVSVIVAG